MLTLFDQQQALDMAMASERREGKEMQAKETALNLHKMGLGYEDIARGVGFAVETVKGWLKGCD